MTLGDAGPHFVTVTINNEFGQDIVTKKYTVLADWIVQTVEEKTVVSNIQSLEGITGGLHILKLRRLCIVRLRR